MKYVNVGAWVRRRPDVPAPDEPIIEAMIPHPVPHNPILDRGERADRKRRLRKVPDRDHHESAR